MTELPKSTQLLQRVSRRLRIQSFGRCLYVSLLVFGGLYAALLLTTRLAGIVPEWFDPLTLGAIPGLALLAALVFHRKPTAAQTARRVDSHQGTHDLFLTLALIDKSAGEYKPLVVRDAEREAPKVKPALVVPFHWSVGALQSAAVLLLLFGMGLLLPQFDPFGRVEAAEQREAEHKELKDSKKNTEMQIAELERERDEKEGEHSKDVKKALEGLKSSLQKVKLGERSTNDKLLAQNQKIIGSKWRSISAETLQKLLSQVQTSQQFGGSNSKNLDKWSRDLKEGSTKSLEKEFNELREQLKELARTKDPVKKAELAQKLKKRMKALEEFARKKAGSEPLAAALKQAMKQLEMAKSENMSQEAMQAAEKSLELAELQLQQMAQSAKDLKALEEALQTLQMAKQLNAMDELDGEAAQDQMSLSDYAKMYREMLAMVGGTPGNPGGGGAPVDEDESTDSDFKTERTKSAITAGKLLMSMKSKGLGEEGEVREDYRALVDQVQQGVSEALDLEQIPPGYHESIKGYFDTIDAQAEPAQLDE